MFAILRSSTGNYLNRDGTLTTDMDAADLYKSIREVFLTIDEHGAGDLDSLQRVAVSKEFGEVIQ